MHASIKKTIQSLPDSPGIYLFFDAKGALIYVGKATSLKNRVRSYFQGARSSRPIEEMIHEVVSIKYQKTDSVLEAVILEANAIRKQKPTYNVLGTDDRSWNYIIITKDSYPKVKSIRQHEFETMHTGSRAKLKDIAHIFGPFPGLNMRAAMKLLRQLFHVSPCVNKRRTNQSGRPCLYYQMGECLGACTGDISASKYKKQVIAPLVQFLKGNKQRVITSLKAQMKASSQKKQFEEAARIRDQIKALTRIHDVAILNASFFRMPKKKTMSGRGFDKQLRIEGYDISNLGPTGKVGSMVVFDNGGPVTSQYRRFKIKSVEGQSDVDCLEEVLTRRLNHPEWKLPDVIMVDGGKPQVNRAKQVLKASAKQIPVVGIAKGLDRKKNEFILGSKSAAFVLWVNEHKNVLVRARDEAHRFAIAYQKKLRKIK